MAAEVAPAGTGTGVPANLFRRAGAEFAGHVAIATAGFMIERY